MTALAELFDPEREQRELEEYLGERYDHERLQKWEHALDSEIEELDEQELYRVSEGYLYNLTAFAMTATKLPYLERLVRYVPPGGRILDFGCGIGSDGLLLLEGGYEVEFADFANPSTEYLRWRLARRALQAPIHDLDRELPGRFDASFAFDVLEHVPDPFGTLAAIERRATVVAVNLLEPSGHDDVQIHHDLPLEDLVRYAAGHRLLLYETLHGDSHLVIYRSWRLGAASRAFGNARRSVWLARRAVARARARRRS